MGGHRASTSSRGPAHGRASSAGRRASGRLRRPGGSAAAAEAGDRAVATGPPPRCGARLAGRGVRTGAARPPPRRTRPGRRGATRRVGEGAGVHHEGRARPRAPWIASMSSPSWLDWRCSTSRPAASAAAGPSPRGRRGWRCRRPRAPAHPAGSGWARDSTTTSGSAHWRGRTPICLAGSSDRDAPGSTPGDRLHAVGTVEHEGEVRAAPSCPAPNERRWSGSAPAGSSAGRSKPATTRRCRSTRWSSMRPSRGPARRVDEADGHRLAVTELGAALGEAGGLQGVRQGVPVLRIMRRSPSRSSAATTSALIATHRRPARRGAARAAWRRDRPGPQEGVLGHLAAAAGPLPRRPGWPGSRCRTGRRRAARRPRQGSCPRPS